MSLHALPTPGTITELLTEFASSPLFLDGTTEATRTVYVGALRALLRDYLSKQPPWITEERLLEAFSHFGAVYSAARTAQAKAAYRRFRDWIMEQYRIALPNLPRGRRGRKSAPMPPEEVLAAALGLLEALPHRALSQARLLTLRWGDVSVEEVAGEKMVRIPGKKPGVYYPFSVNSEAGQAMKVLYKHVGREPMREEPLLPREVGSLEPLPLASLRQGLARIKSLREGETGRAVVNGSGEDGTRTPVGASLAALDGD